jgi:hypothetical protein
VRVLRSRERLSFDRWSDRYASRSRRYNPNDPHQGTTAMNGDRSRYACHYCSKRLKTLVICDQPYCPRCLRKCQVQRILSPDEPLPEPKTRDERLAEKILGRAMTFGRFQLPPKKEMSNAGTEIQRT